MQRRTDDDVGVAADAAQPIHVGGGDEDGVAEAQHPQPVRLNRSLHLNAVDECSVATGQIAHRPSAPIDADLGVLPGQAIVAQLRQVRHGPAQDDTTPIERDRDDHRLGAGKDHHDARDFPLARRRVVLRRVARVGEHREFGF